MKNESFYNKTKLRDEDKFDSFINKSSGWKFILIPGLFAVFAPFLPRRHSRNYPTNGDEYIQQVIITGTIIAIIILIAIWTLIIKPYLNFKKGYNLRGQFEVTKKSNFLGRRILELQPGRNHFIKVDRQSYTFISVGDKVFVERKALGELIKIKRV
jgi:hypothetical protein